LSFERLIACSGLFESFNLSFAKFFCFRIDPVFLRIFSKPQRGTFFMAKSAKKKPAKASNPQIRSYETKPAPKSKKM